MIRTNYSACLKKSFSHYTFSALASIDVTDEENPKTVDPSSWGLQDQKGETISAAWLARNIRILNARATKLKNVTRTVGRMQQVMK